MKLYLYDHCPYCIRAEMTGRYKEVPFEVVYLLNDDEQTCFRLVNAKQVPILTREDGSSMPESLDIARVFDDIGNPDRVILKGGDHKRYNDVIDSVSLNINCLLFPRNIAIGLPEFATQSSRDYFQHKKEKLIDRPFQQAFDQTQQHKSAVEEMLFRLPQLPDPQQHDNQLSWDDVMIYPVLRNLSIVKDLKFPDQVRRYVEAIARLTNTHTYFERAI